ncbi:MAG: molybdopterin-dependent oxidoreductase [Actinobacteria bacterium]|nr:molybdopterin-dependent oxidoreductase [Actinomycetota bacterium]
MIELVVNGRVVEVRDDGSSLLEALRDQLRVRSPKDGCSPQGQCGCCTVLVDGQPRVSCVTPVRRAAGRTITTIEGLPNEVRAAWSEAFLATGASQCGFCTPGIIMRLEPLRARGDAGDERAAEKALQAHLCRCTGWRTVVDAASSFGTSASMARDFDAAGRRAAIEGGSPQHVGPQIALGAGGFADDAAPDEALVAVRRSDGEWAVGETLNEARERAGKVQGRHTTIDVAPPLQVPIGKWARTLQTSWVEPAYLETDASWCAPGGDPVTPLANGGAFGGKVDSPVAAVARQLADRYGRPVRVLFSREDCVRLGPKRPPIAAGVNVDGSGAINVVRTQGITESINAVAPAWEVREVDVAGPPTSAALHGAGWVEAAVLQASLVDVESDLILAPNGAQARAEVIEDGGGEIHLSVCVSCGAVLDEVVLRSYCIGAAHMAMSWVTSEGLAVDAAGEVHDLTIRSFGILRAVETPLIEVEIVDDRSDPVNGSDAVFAAVAAAVWRHQGFPEAWPTRQPLCR